MRSPAPPRRPSTLLAGAAATLLAAAALGVVGCGASDGERSELAREVHPRAPGGPPGIVLLCVDTLRADAVSTEPGARAWMPALDAFARGGTRFADAASSSSWTAPAIATLLTGLEVARTGAQGVRPLSLSVTTVAEALQAQGWSTAAVTGGSWVTASRGYAQGFDAFSEDFESSGPETTIARWQARRAPDAPFFLFLHTVAPHDPYGDKTPGGSPRSDDADIADKAAAYLRAADERDGVLDGAACAWFLDNLFLDYGTYAAIHRAVAPARVEVVYRRTLDWLDGDGFGTPALAALTAKAEAAYRAGLGYADRVVARTLSALDRFGMPEGTVVAVVGDHGEALGEHGTLLHGRWLYDEVARVPLVVRAPGRLPAGAVVRGSCGLVDVVPTLLDLAGVPVPAGLDGRSLLPLARGEEGGHPIFAEEDRMWTRTAPTHGQRVVSVRTTAAKLIVTYDLRTLNVERTELYDLAADPGETTPLSEAEEARFGAEFARAAARLRASIPGLAAPKGSAPPDR